MKRKRSFFTRRITLSLVAMSIVIPVQLLTIPEVDEAWMPIFAVMKSEAESVPGLPVRVRIPKIGVDADIISVGLIPGTQKVDVPKDGHTVGWYSPGPRPGEEGNAVLDGHLNLGGQPGVFFDLKHLSIGDVIVVEDADGVERSFRVRDTDVYEVRGAPMQRIFGKTDGRRLNIITCAGVWKEELNHYDKRLIIYSEAM